VRVASILGKQHRTHRVNRARSIAYYLARELTGDPFMQLGQAFGRDPQTVQKGGESVRARLPRDPKMRALVADLRRQIEPKLAEIEDASGSSV
jgi:chromosomal replication initiation ATPase DnaA